MMNQEEIQQIIAEIETEISNNSIFINVLVAFVETAKTFDGKVLNCRFTNALNAATNENIRVYDYKPTYRNDGVQFPVYIQRSQYCEYNNKYFLFAGDCFTLTESGKMRINAKEFSDRCAEIRNEIIAENTILRRDISNVYQMLADAENLKRQVKEYQEKYSYRITNKFKVAYRLQNW